MSWPVILSGVAVAMLALGFNLLLPLSSGLEAVCDLTRRRVRCGLFRPRGWRIAESLKRGAHQPDAHSGPPLAALLRSASRFAISALCAFETFERRLKST